MKMVHKSITYELTAHEYKSGSVVNTIVSHIRGLNSDYEGQWDCEKVSEPKFDEEKDRYYITATFGLQLSHS